MPFAFLADGFMSMKGRSITQDAATHLVDGWAAVSAAPWQAAISLGKVHVTVDPRIEWCA